MSHTSLHILYTGPFRFPEGDAAAARVLNNARALRLAGHRVGFLSYGGEYLDRDAVAKGYAFDGFPYTITHDIDRSGESPVRRIFNFLTQGSRAIKELKKSPPPDLVIAYNPAFVTCLRLLWLSRARKFRFVADLTEWYHPSEFPGGKWMPFAWINELNIRWALRLIPNKLVISSYLNRYYTTSHNLVVPPLVDTQEEKWSEQTADIPAFDGISCIYAGTPSGKDQVLFLLEALNTALAKGARVRLIFLGEELDPIRNAMQSPRLISCRNNIVFAGKVQQSRVPAYYKTADFSVLFREHNRKNDAGFPTKFVESMAAGVPVIGNLTSDIGNYLLDGHNGFVVGSVNADLLADLFVRLNDLTEQQLTAMKKAARTTAVQHFDYRIHQEKLSRFLHSTR